MGHDGILTHHGKNKKGGANKKGNTNLKHRIVHGKQKQRKIKANK